MKKKRLDQLLVDRGLCDRIITSERVIMAGLVFVNHNRVDKKGTLIPEDADIELRSLNPMYVSRGGDKLASVFPKFHIDIANKVAMDIGSSTGGFTDYLCQNGIKKVFAIDVGTHQLHEKLRNDPRIILMENQNIRELSFSQINETVDLIVMDLSFISITKIIPLLHAFLKPTGDVVSLIKPQFELGYDEVSKGRGVITDEALIEKAITSVEQVILESGFVIMAKEPSGVKGVHGNQEWFIHFKCL